MCDRTVELVFIRKKSILWPINERQGSRRGKQRVPFLETTVQVKILKQRQLVPCHKEYRRKSNSDVLHCNDEAIY